MKILSKIFKLFLIFLGGVLCLLILLIFAINLLFQSSSFTGYLTSKILPPIGDKIGAKIGVETLRISLFPTSILIEGALFTPAEGTFKREFATLDRLWVDVDTLALLTGRVVVEDLVVDGARNYLLIDNGLANLPIKLSGKKKEKKKRDKPFVLKLPIIIDKLKIKNSSFHMDIPKADLELAVEDLGMNGTASLSSGDAKVDIDIRNVTFRLGDKLNETVDSLEVSAIANLQSWNAKLEKLELRAPLLELDAEGIAENMIAGLSTQVKAELRVDAAMAQKYVANPKINGHLVLDVSGEFGLPKEGMKYAYEGDLKLTGGSVNNLPVNLKSHIFADRGSVKVSKMRGNIGTGTLDIWADLSLGQGLPINSKIILNQLDVGNAAKGYGIQIPMDGIVDLELAASGALARPTGQTDENGKKKSSPAIDLKGMVDVANLNIGKGAKRVFGVSNLGINLDSSYVGKVVRANLVSIYTKSNTIDITGTYNTTGPMNLRLSMLLEDMSEFSPILDKEVAGTGKISAHAQGTVSNPNIKAETSFSHLGFGRYFVEQVDGSISMEGKTARLSPFTILTGDSKIKLEGEAKLEKPMTLNASLEIPESKISDFLKMAGQEKLDINGKVNADITVNGPIDKLNGKITLNAGSIKAYGEDIQTVKVDSHLEFGVIHLDDVQISKIAPPRVDFNARKDIQFRHVPKDKWETVSIAAKGRFDPATKEIELKLRTSNLNEQASDTVREKRMPLSAAVAVAADVSGTIDDPQVKAKFEILRARYGNFIFGDSILTATVENQKAKVHADLLSNRWIERIIPAKKGWVIIHSDKLTARPSSETEEEQLEKAEDFARAVETDQVVKETGEFGAITLDLTADITGNRDVKGELLFNQFDYSGFLQFLKDQTAKTKMEGTPETKIAGKINGRIDIEGVLDQLSKALVQVNLDKLRFRKDDLILANIRKDGSYEPIKLSIQDGQIRIDKFKLGGTAISISVEEMESAADGSLAITSKMDIAALKEFTSFISESKGTVFINATVPRSFRIKDITARATLDNGLLDLQNSPTAIENLNFVASFNKGTAKIETMTGNMGGGTLVGEGRVVFDVSESKKRKKKKSPDINLVVKIRNVKTGYDPDLETVINKINLILSDREKGGMQVSGEVVVDKLIFTQEIDFIKMLRDFRQPKKTRGSETFKEKKENIFFNIAIRAERNLLYQSNMADIEAKTDMLFTGSNAAPALLGTVEVIKGRAEVLSNEYKVSRAVITFLDEDRIFPNFDINAETQKDDVTVFVVVSGNPDRYKITFSSDPPMPEKNIFALLALGISYEEVQAGSSEISSDELASVVAQQLISNQIKGLTGKSGIEIEVDYSAGEPRLNVKSEIQKDLYLSIFRGITDDSLGAEVEYDFIRNMSLLGNWENLAGYEDATSIGAIGTGIKLKLEFK